MPERVLVNGVSGFLGGHVALALLRQGYAVRGSLRDSARRAELRKALKAHSADTDQLEFCNLNLLQDSGWHEAASGCDHLVHTASPFVLKMPRNADQLVRPAVEGTRRAVQAALDAGHRRIVVTSSLAAIDCGHRSYERPLGPADWTDLQGPDITAYMRSKVLAEREAWSCAEQRSARQQLCVINPGTLLGPLIDKDPGTSATVVQRMLRGRMPMVPDLVLPYVDMRDVAEAHVAALRSPHAGGQRHLMTNGALPLIAIARLLRDGVPQLAGKVATRRMPTWMAQAFSTFDKALRDARAYLGVRRRYDSASGISLLGRPLRDTAEAVAATARSLRDKGLA